jgi:hypothetical protein
MTTAGVWLAMAGRRGVLRAQSLCGVVFEGCGWSGSSRHFLLAFDGRTVSQMEVGRQWPPEHEAPAT